MKHGVVGGAAKSTFNGFQVKVQRVRGDLDAVADPAGTVFHECLGAISVAGANKVADHEFGIRVDPNPGPGISPALLLLERVGVPFLSADEAPDLIGLHPAHLQVAHVLVMEFGAGTPCLHQQLENGVDRGSGQAHRSADGTAFN